VFAGALVASAVILFLLTLGSGIGLSLFSFPEATANTARKALTGGSIYFFASLAFGFAVGGYLAGRLMGPRLETEEEEMFHASTHGLVTWALGVVMTAMVVVGSAVVLTGAGLNAAAILGSANTSNAQAASLTPSLAGYWVDVLFRPAGETGSAAAPGSAAQPVVVTPQPNDATARAEVTRILTVGLANTGQLTQPDHDRVAALVSRYSGVDPAEANRRVDDVQNRIHRQEVAAAENARWLAKTVSLWLAASLIFAALVASGTAVTGRWVDDEAREVT
jgi:hypothetical protein